MRGLVWGGEAEEASDLVEDGFSVSQSCSEEDQFTVYLGLSGELVKLLQLVLSDTTPILTQENRQVLAQGKEAFRLTEHW